MKQYFIIMAQLFYKNWSGVLYPMCAHGNFWNLFAAAFYSLGLTLLQTFIRLIFILFFPVSPLLIMWVENQNMYTFEYPTEINEDL